MAARSRVVSKHVPVLVGTALLRFGERLTTARKLRLLTLEQLAHLSDVSISTLVALERGADGVAVGNLLKVLQGLNLLAQFDDLLDPGRDPEAVAYALRSVRGR